MIDTSKEYGKLHLILELIDRKDIRKSLDEKFSKKDQEEIFKMLKEIMLDEITFVIAIKESEKQSLTH